MTMYEIVQEVLAEVPETRGNDFLLYEKVCEALGVKVKKSFRRVMKNPEKYGLPYFTTVLRHKYPQNKK